MVDFIRKSTSLILCSNPLQMLIAQKIIDLHPNNRFDLIVTCPKNNEKYAYYFDKLQKRCNICLFFIEGPGIRKFLEFKAKLKNNGLNKDYSKIYVASIDSRYYRYIISKNSKSTIYTFDDGLANIIDTSHYYITRKQPFFKKIIWRGLGIKFTTQDIRFKSNLHFTIYDKQPNIIKNTQFISLLDSLNSYRSEVLPKRLNIFIGQPMIELSNHYDKEYITKVLRKLKIDCYYPHPKEDNVYIPKDQDVEVIYNKLICEDYIIELLNDNPSLEIYLYSFFSSSIVNLANTHRVRVFFIHDTFLYNRLESFYKNTQESMGIPNIDISLNKY